MRLTPLTIDQLEFRLAEEPGIECNWFVPHLHDEISYEPEGCFALLDDDQTVGMITSTVYQEIGWLGWLYVSKKHRQKGLGAQLMRQGLQFLRDVRGVRTILLEAVPEATSLYRRLGFKTQFITQHYLLSKPNLNHTSQLKLKVVAVLPDMIEHVTEFDMNFFPQSRGRMIGLVLSNPNFSGYVAETNGRMVGYLFLTETANNRQVSPMIVDPAADAPDVAAALIQRAFDDNPKPLYFRCPMVTPDRAEILESLSATHLDCYTERMLFGDSYRVESDGVLSLGCPSKG